MQEKLELAHTLSESANVDRDQADDQGEPTKGQLLGEAKHQFKIQLLREAHFEGLPFHETGWEILLELYIAQVEGRRLSVTAIGLDGHVPTATMVRWLALFEQRNLVSRLPDKDDRRRTWILLTSLGYTKIEACLCECLAHKQKTV